MLDPSNLFKILPIYKETTGGNVYSVDTGRKLNVHKTFRRRWASSEPPMNVQFTSCLYGVYIYVGNLNLCVLGVPYVPVG